jgi:hypothetical protein
MSDPLNPALYNLLKSKFAEVKIANEGCPAYYTRLVDPLNANRTIIRAADWGEYYCVRCPFCNDHRQRLWINHRYGSEVNYGRRQLTHLANCYNEQCLQQAGRLEQLEQIIFGIGSHLKPKPLPIKPVDAAFTPTVVEPPGEIVALTELPPDHPARIYLESRGFDPDLLSTQFQIGFCVSAKEPKFEVMVNRLYIPIIFRNELVGWQCRAIGPTTAPKYLNAHMRKSGLLYNFDNAISQPFIIIVEGVPSVWRLGSAAVCIFGKSLSMLQQNLITQNFRNKPIFLMLDSDARTETDRAYTALTQHGLKVVPILLPDERDPADYTFNDITDIVMSNVASAGLLDVIV